MTTQPSLSPTITSPGKTGASPQAIGTFVAARLVDFVNSGSTSGCVNLPQIGAPAVPRAHRFLHLHRNQPGVLAAVNGVFARRRINILGQALRTDEAMGYLVTDVDRRYAAEVVDELRAVDGTVRLRVLY